MKYVCIVDKSIIDKNRYSLTPNKIYYSLSKKSPVGWIFIKDDDGCLCNYHYSLFKPLNEYRVEQLKKICTYLIN